MPELSDLKTKRKPKYTSHKLNLLKASRFDRTISAFDKLVLAAIADHMNNHTGQTWPVADETIALEIGSGWRSVIRSRMKLRKAGYLTWHRTRTSNVYGFNFAKAKSTLEMLAAIKKNAMSPDSRVISALTPESEIPVISPVKEESPKVEAYSRVSADMTRDGSLPSEQLASSGREQPLTPAQLDAVIDLAVEIGVIEQPAPLGGQKSRAA
jgi:hypothetical protein